MTRFHIPPVARRWRFIAAVAGVTALAGGGVLLAAPSDPATALAFHTVPTVRLLDTRPATQVGSEAEPLGLGETLDLEIKGLPDDATAVSINVTVVDGTEGSFLTVYPKGSARPTTSTVNWDSAGAEANSATVVLGADKSLTIYNLKGTVNVVIDLLGYYALSPAGDGAAGPAGPAGAPGAPGTSTPGVFLSANNTITEGIPTGESLTFDTVTATQGGITAVGPPGSAIAFIVPTDGTYNVSFTAAVVEASVFDIQVNGGAAVPVALKFSAGANQTNVGTAVLTLLLAGDVITVDNLTSGGTVNLATGTGAINATITIDKLS